ncbi:alpha-mannosidase [Mycobacterium sp. CBMA293]|uniref:glycoside hydrolase family 38 N-terminal domain-containing protein n=1 Tax=unclassified Mycolicibacterium TaxID=2636767 RepID=UPI0012DE5E72|nr:MULTISPECIES: NEW3 domain-containing protein [unclassified Mycolicibacterium]MUL44739.1 alpha-mannosidase [Mycolicibacterium sp. CBMA 360]MUL60064.1 alpha-mannosidase [Mycolicibacterium sp. CBMA 335]MUL68907.1 alpha-mannosidase [Mycolicibacterium sp. CBMA 311]MUL93702.1 alpha-mannosidase [Mycolicibacterium sp. CBMA 230]MUM05945.1 alpha-mannosidase [Mycolicibacterium sp. CBMA 213]
MQVTAVVSTELFVGSVDEPLQIVRVDYTGCAEPTPVRVAGAGLAGEAVAEPGEGTVEIPVVVTDPVVGQTRSAHVEIGGAEIPFEFVVAEPGWTMYMISHFHYDPVWWNTQAAYTSVWTEDPPGRCRQTNGFDLVTAHLEMARREPEYKFVLAEVDYLKPYWDTHPEQRAQLRALLAEDRIEIMGGTYNEPNTNLTSPETAIRNFVHGIGFQRDVMGADPATAWQLDVFGHDPQFPGMAADAGLTSSSWARGPHHQWGPMHRDGDPERMQFASEFDWIAPSGRGLLTHYMPAHYAAGWWMDSSASLQEAQEATFATFLKLKKVALTRNVLLPVGTDYTPPNKWVTEIHRDWATRYVWPRFVCALPREFFAAVRAELADRGATASPQTRDMNPIYTGKDVSYIDTKQANRAAENVVLEAERFAVFAGLLTGATYPHAALAKAWVQLAYGAHHDGITGSESDQVYLDLLTGWRDAWELGRSARDNAVALLSRAVDGEVVVWNPLARNRTDIVTVHLNEPLAGSVFDADGSSVPVLIEDDGHTVTWLARDVPSLGWRGYRIDGGSERSVWEPLSGNTIGNEHYTCTVDPNRGGAVASLTCGGVELIGVGQVGNEIAVYDEYSAHPTEHEGPWHLLPKGPVVGSSERPADSVRAYRCALGERLVITGRIGDTLHYTQTITLWHGVDRVDCRTVVEQFTGADKLLRLRWPCPVPGAMPVSEVGDAVIGRGFGLLHQRDSHDAVDTADHPYTLDNPAYGWFGLSSAVQVRVRDAHGDGVRAISVAEVVASAVANPRANAAAPARELMVALVRAGVTATCSQADKPRYGDLSVDSNLPDARIALGGPDENPFTAAVLAAADPCYGAELQRRLATGSARLWVPADADLVQRWIPGADLRGVRALPVLIVAGPDATTALIDDLADAVITVEQDAAAGIGPFDARTVAVLNRGVPGFAVEPDGVLHTSLMRSCTGWPSGTWIDPPRRTAPDGSNFQLQHWTHTFDYAIAAGAGDWRTAGISGRSSEYSHPLLGVYTDHPAVAGGLPCAGSLLGVEPASEVALAALKATGNPIAAGSSAMVDPREGITLRLVQTSGSPTEVRVTSGLRHLEKPERLDLLEQPLTTDVDALRLHGFEIATVRARLDLPHVLNGDHVTLAPDAEVAQPVYARYWLHNRGPAPLGGLPAVAHVHPTEATGEPGTPVRLRVTAASDCTDTTLHGRVRVQCPAGWSDTSDELPFMLPPGGYLETEVQLELPADVAPGRYPIRVELAVTGGAKGRQIPGAWRQTVEDVCIVTVGEPAGTELLTLVAEPEAVDVVAGERAFLSVTVGTDAGAPLSLEAHLISPWGTWEWLGPSVVGADIPAGGTVALDFDVAPPRWVDPGQWWALIRIAAAGRVLYTPAVSVRVR